MASELHTADDDDYESDLGDPEAAWEAFASTLLPGTRAVLEGYGPASDFGADEPEPKPEQICLSLCELLEVIKTCLSNGGTRALSPNHHEELRGALAQALP